MSIDLLVRLFLEDDSVQVKSSDMVLGVLTMLCELFNAHAVVQSEATVLAILRNVELLNEDDHSIETAISALTSCLRCTASDAVRLQVVKVLFDEVSKGARYSATQSDLAALYEEYQNDGGWSGRR